MTEKKKAGRPPNPVTAKQVLEMAEKMPASERAKLENLGISLAQGTDGIDNPEDSIYGIACVHCNRLALRFIGKTFNGQPAPIPGTRLDQILWTQDKVVPNRQRPLCQHCGGTIRLSKHGGILPPGEPTYGYVHIADWEKQRAKSFSAATIAEQKARYRGKTVDLQKTSHSFDDQSRGDALSHVEKVAQTGTIGIPGTPAAEPSGQPIAPAGHRTAVMEELAEISGLNELSEGGLGNVAKAVGTKPRS